MSSPSRAAAFAMLAARSSSTMVISAEPGARTVALVGVPSMRRLNVSSPSLTSSPPEFRVSTVCTGTRTASVPTPFPASIVTSLSTAV